MIPKIIHQTWKTREIPESWSFLVESWKSFHPDWDYRFWTDKDCVEFVEEYFPEFLSVYQAYPYGIQRADAFRYLVLFQHGGMYVDMDFECIRNFDELVDGRSFLIAYEPVSHEEDLGMKNVPGNALIGSIPGHPFIKDIIDHLADSGPTALVHRDVLISTGPLMVHQIFQQYSGEPLEILPSRVFYPFKNNSPQIAALKAERQNKKLRTRLLDANCFAVHYWDNTWAINLAGVLNNPEPYKIPGYAFFPGLDSSGNDIGNGGRYISQLAQTCNKLPGAIAFNTDGFIKSRLEPLPHWKYFPNPDGNRGLYVKRQESREIEYVSGLCEQKYFIYTSHKGESRILELLSDYKIGRGAEYFERSWQIYEHGSQWKLLIFGDEGLSAILQPISEKHWRGRSKVNETDDIEFIADEAQEAIRTGLRDEELDEQFIREQMGFDERHRYQLLQLYRRTVSSVAEQKRLIAVDNETESPVPFGEEEGDLCPDVLFYLLKRNNSDTLYWGKKETGLGTNTLAQEVYIYQNLQSLSSQALQPVDYLNSYGLIFPYQLEIFESKYIVHYTDRHQYFDNEEVSQIEKFGDKIIDHPRLPQVPLRALTDFQSVKTSHGLVFIDFSPEKKFFC